MGIADRNKIAFSCDTCDGTPLANNAGVTVAKPSDEPRTCKGILCIKENPLGVEHPIKDFGKNRAAPDGLQWNCKKCICESVKQAKLNRAKTPCVKAGKSAKAIANDPLFEKLMEKLSYHKSEIEKIEKILKTIKEITEEEVRSD